jgi:hypothetical protein
MHPNLVRRPHETFIIEAAGYSEMVTVSCHVYCGGPCGSPANGAVVVLMVAVPGRMGWQVAVAPPSVVGAEVQASKSGFEDVNGCHGWRGEAGASSWTWRPTTRQMACGEIPVCTVTRPAVVHDADEAGEGLGGGVAVDAAEAAPPPDEFAVCSPALAAHPVTATRAATMKAMATG